MKKEVGISGYGREGQAIHHYLLNKESKQRVSKVLTSPRVESPANIAYALTHDTLRGNLEQGRVKVEGEKLLIDGQPVKLIVRDLISGSSMPIEWGDQVKLVYEASGRIKSEKLGRQHLADRNERRIIYTCRLDPKNFSDKMKTIILGVNEEDFDPKRHFHISNASCSTKAAVVTLTLLEEYFGPFGGVMASLTHGYTPSQPSIDKAHPKDPRKGRLRDNIVPYSSNSEKGIAEFFPDANIDVRTVRVPEPIASYMDLMTFFPLNRRISEEEVNDWFKKQAEGPRKRVIGFDENMPVSSDFRLDTHAAVLDASLTAVIHDSGFGFSVVRLGIWYNHEYGSAAQAAKLGDYILKRVYAV